MFVNLSGNFINFYSQKWNFLVKWITFRLCPMMSNCSPERLYSFVLTSSKWEHSSLHTHLNTILINRFSIYLPSIHSKRSLSKAWISSSVNFSYILHIFSSSYRLYIFFVRNIFFNIVSFYLPCKSFKFVCDKNSFCL